MSSWELERNGLIITTDDKTQLRAACIRAERREQLIHTEVMASFPEEEGLARKAKFSWRKEAGERGIQLGEAPCEQICGCVCSFVYQVHVYLSSSHWVTGFVSDSGDTVVCKIYTVLSYGTFHTRGKTGMASPIAVRAGGGGHACLWMISPGGSD